jgi:hypothetical protein
MMNRKGKRGYKREKRRESRRKEGERGLKRERRKERQPVKGGDC